MLDALERATLVAIDRLTRDSYDEVDGEAIVAELRSMGHEPEALVLFNLVRRLKDDGYVDAYFAGGGTIAFARLTGSGREEARDMDSFERVFGEARHALSSDVFAQSYAGAFEPWAAAERLLWETGGNSNLTTIGHNVREAMQAFATAIVEEHQPSEVDPNPANVEKRLGAVIAMHRSRLGTARREALEALGTLWTKVNRLVQRQEHGAQKEGEPVTWSDARRIVYLSMFCMVEFVDTFEDMATDTPAELEHGH